MRVLIVDDNRDGATTLNLLLKLVGHESRWASDGLTGLETAKSWQPDVILLDVGLPKLDGYQVAEQIRANVGLTQPRIWMLSAYNQDDVRFAAARIDGYLQKPARFNLIQNAIATGSAQN